MSDDTADTPLPRGQASFGPKNTTPIEANIIDARNTEGWPVPATRRYSGPPGQGPRPLPPGAK